jgi:acetyltransferase-like isoleucine patch superfamily enzyme
MGLRRALRGLANAACLVAAAPWAAVCWIEARVTVCGEAVFAGCAQTFALVPGPPGVYLRRAFYRLTLDACAADCYIGFGTVFSHRRVRVESNAYIGNYSLIGSAWLHERCLVGSRVSLLSGGALHRLGADRRWTPTDLRRTRQIHVHEDAWIGEAALVLADVGPWAMVAAGAVVSAPVRGGVIVAGNPARFVRQLHVEGVRAAAIG